MQTGLAQALQPCPPILPATASLQEAVEMMYAASSECVLVINQHQDMSIFTTQDLLRAIATHTALDTPLQHWTLTPIATVTEAELPDLAVIMPQLQQSSVGYLLVINGVDQAIGVITTTSLCSALQHQIQELQQEVQQRQHQENRYRNIVENAVEGIFQTTSEGHYLTVNPTLAKIYGYDTCEELITALTDIEHQLYVDSHRRAEFVHLMATYGQVQEFEAEIFRKDGSVIWISENARAVRSEDGTLLYYEGSIIDISDRKRAEHTLRHKNIELATALQQLQTAQQELIQSEKMAALGQLIAGVAHEINTPLGAIRSSIENIAEFVNEHLPQLPTFFQTLSPEQFANFLTLMQRSRQQSDTFSSKEKRQFKRQLMRQLETASIANADVIADTLVDIHVYEDIDALLPLLAHPQGINLLKQVYQWVSVGKSTETITTAVNRAAKIVFALKTYTHHDLQGNKITANLTEGIETVLTLYHNHLKHGVEVVRNYDLIPPILCYPDELNQVWTNLIHNALQAMDYSGRLEIKASLKDGQIHIDITDSGKGIAPEHLPHIFQPFFTTKPAGEGSGLGLDITKRIIDKHGGAIAVESVAGKTTFTVSIPAVQAS